MPKRKPKLTIRTLKRVHARELADMQQLLDRALARIEQLVAALNHYKRQAARDYAVRCGREPAPEIAADPREVEMNWNMYDQIAASITANERALFEASPAYQKYQQWRKTGGMVKTGDWRAP